MAGRLYALSTVGSLVGVFFVSLWSIEAIGSQRTFLVLAAVPALVAASGLGARFFARPARADRRAGDPAGHDQARRGRRPRALRDRDAVPVRARDRGGRRDAQARAQRGPGDPFAEAAGHGADRRLLGRLSSCCRSRPARAARRRRIAALGTAGGTVPRAYAQFFPETRIDAVDIDPELFEIGRKYFDLRAAAAAARVRRGRAAVPALDRRALRLDLRRRLPPALHPVLPDHARVLRARPRPAEPGRLGDHQHRASARLERAREGAERDPGRGVRPRRPRPDPVAELARDRLRLAAQRRGAARGAGAGRAASRWRRRRSGRLADALPGGTRLHRRQRAGRVADRRLDRAVRGGGGLDERGDRCRRAARRGASPRSSSSSPASRRSGAEIAAARLVAPAFGASTVVWANTIAVVLVALASGYCRRRPASPTGTRTPADWRWRRCSARR